MEGEYNLKAFGFGLSFSAQCLHETPETVPLHSTCNLKCPKGFFSSPLKTNSVLMSLIHKDRWKQLKGSELALSDIQGNLLSVIITSNNNKKGKAVNLGCEQVLNIYICWLKLIGAVGLCPWTGTICAWNKFSNKSLIDFSCVGWESKVTSSHELYVGLKREIN